MGANPLTATRGLFPPKTRPKMQFYGPFCVITDVAVGISYCQLSEARLASLPQSNAPRAGLERIFTKLAA